MKKLLKEDNLRIGIYTSNRSPEAYGGGRSVLRKILTNTYDQDNGKTTSLSFVHATYEDLPQSKGKISTT